MAIKCRMVDPATLEKGGAVPGDMYLIPAEKLKTKDDGSRWWRIYRLSDEYERDRAQLRLPLAVVLPNGMHFCIDSAVSDETRGWQVTGEPPAITVSPSIHIVGDWHGWLQNGELRDA